MKDEIKEILEQLKIRNDLYNDRDESCIVPIEYYEAHILLDYITNLQEIAEEHKNCTRKHWQQKCAEHCANEMIYKSRNEKAIEYIYEHREEALFEYNNGKLVYALSDNFDEGDLLNILQGEDKDDNR